MVGIVEKEGLKWGERDLGRIGKMDLANMILESTSRLQAQVETVSQPLEVKLNYIPKGGTSDQSSLSRSNRSKSRNRISSQGTLLPSSSFIQASSFSPPGRLLFDLSRITVRPGWISKSRSRDHL